MLNAQLANTVDPRSIYSPALPTANQGGFPHPFPLNSAFPLQTPIQTSFFPHPTNVPTRPQHAGHRAHASMAQLASAGIQPPVPMTPLGQGTFPHQAMHSGQVGVSQPFVPKSRRTPSMLGGPPKAPLGGPGKKVVTPIPAAALAVQEKLKAKKVIVKLPVESDINNEDGKSLWTRVPIPSSSLEVPKEVSPPETNSANIFPDDSFAKLLPPTVDVFLPGKVRICLGLLQSLLAHVNGLVVLVIKSGGLG